MLFSEIKTSSQLKAFVESGPTDSHFFTRGTMKFFGDTMRNYGVRHLTNGVIELYRKRPVKHDVDGSAYFKASECGSYAVRTFDNEGRGE